MPEEPCPECGAAPKFCECPPTICLNEDCQAQFFPGEEGYRWAECIECGGDTDEG